MKRIAWLLPSALMLSTGCATTVANKPTATQTYQVFWEMHFGYALERNGERILPDIAPSERPKFDEFFSDANLAKMLGKRIYCDCEVAVASDGLTPRVVRAKLYAR